MDESAGDSHPGRDSPSLNQAKKTAHAYLDRQIWSSVGIVCLVVVALFSETGSTATANAFAYVAFVCFAIAIVDVFLEVDTTSNWLPLDVNSEFDPSKGLVERPFWKSDIQDSDSVTLHRTFPKWIFPSAVVGVALAGSVQMWYLGGGAIAGGDETPPIGTAWISHLLSPWGWSGSNLGVPAIGTLSLPWALTEQLVHSLGGSGALAQRLSYSVLFALVGIAAVALLTALQFEALPAIVGGLIYALNAYTVAETGVNYVFLSALVLVPFLITWVVTASRARRLQWHLLSMIPLSMMLGVVTENPPLTLACVGSMALSPILVRWLYGPKFLWPAIRRTVQGLAALAVLSAYWSVPYAIQIISTAEAHVGASISWQWTEIRDTLANVFWLNGFWTWNYPATYFPDAVWYQQFPLVFAKYLLPIVALSTLGIMFVSPRQRLQLRVRLLAAASASALFIIFLSTGTNSPGSILFDVLYRLPLGWLLQEPDRFLFLAGLAFAVLIAIWIENFARSVDSDHPINSENRDTWRRRRFVPNVIKFGAIIVVSFVLLLPGIPFVTGGIVPGLRPPYPSDHVKVPPYWDSMAQFVNRDQQSGNLLVLPADDFYQMPYTWFYGSDTFIANLISRNVLNPNGQGYGPASQQLLRADQLFQRDLLADNWQGSLSVAQVMDTRFVLVRGDIESDFPSRKIVNPVTLDSRLANDPDARLVGQYGPLELYEFRSSLGSLIHPVTVNTISPDLRFLTSLAPKSALVSARALPGIPELHQFAPLDSWPIKGDALIQEAKVPKGDKLSLLAASNETESKTPITPTTTHVELLRVHETLSNESQAIRVTVPLGDDLLTGNASPHVTASSTPACSQAFGPEIKSNVFGNQAANSASSDTRIFKLVARTRGQCVGGVVSGWAGNVLISLEVQDISGPAPQLCLWEVSATGVGQCATSITLPSNRSWTRFQTVVIPAAGTQSLALYLETAFQGGEVSSDHFANVRVYRAPSDQTRFSVLATPVHQANYYLTSNAESFSSDWIGPDGARHVIVDGLTNGWMSARRMGHVTTRFAFDSVDTGANFLSLAAAFALVVFTLVSRGRRRSEDRGTVSVSTEKTKDLS